MLPSLNQRCRGKMFSLKQPNVRIITHTNYGNLTYLNYNFHAVTSTLVKPNYAYGRFTVATLQWIKATILSAPISKTDVLNSHSDIFKNIAVLNSWQKYLKNICEAHFSSCIFLLYGNKLLRFHKFLPHLQKFEAQNILICDIVESYVLQNNFHCNVKKSCLF